MAEGTDTFMGRGMPIDGNVTLTGQVAGTDILTITAAGSQSGDYLVLQDSSGTEDVVIDSDGNISITGGGGSFTATELNSTYLNLGTSTTAPTTGVDQGDFFAFWTGTVARLGIITTGTTKKYTTKFAYTVGSSS